MSTYVYIDISSKQEYIYNSNKLAENLERSFIIKALTEEIKDIENYTSETKLLALTSFLNDEFTGFEFVFSGGGNSIVKFIEKSKAVEFVRNYSKAVLIEYPEIELYMSMFTNTGMDKTPKEIREILIKKLAEIKDARHSRFRRWTYGIEKINEFGKGKLVDNKEPNGVRTDKKGAKKYLEVLFKGLINNNKVRIIDDLNQYENYIGVISIDGNRMGDMVKKAENFNELKELGNIISKIYKKAVFKAFNELVENAEPDADEKISITPIVLAGDDICLIVDAKYAILASARIIENIKGISIEIIESKEKKEDQANREVEKNKEGKKTEVNKITETEIKVFKKVMNGTKYLTACGGVVIVKQGYPFFESVEFADNLCKEAKEYECRIEGDASMLTWQISRGAVLKNLSYLSNIRSQDKLEESTIKPLRVDETKTKSRVDESEIRRIFFSFKDFETIIEIVKKSEIGKTALHSIKQEFYSGIDNYWLAISEKKRVAKHRDFFKEIDDSIQEILKNESDCTVKDGVVTIGAKHYYILNDIINSLDFIGGEKNEQV